MNCQDVRTDMGVHVLGQAGEQEARAVEEHVRECDACRAELEALRGLPDLLALVRDDPEHPPAALRERVLGAAARRRRLRRMALPAAAVLALGMLIGAVVFGPMVTGERDALRLALASGDGYSARGEAVLRPAAGGVVVELALEALPTLPPGGVYEAWLAQPGADEPLSIGRLTPDPAGRAVVTLRAPGAPRDYRSIWVTAEPDAADPGHDGPTVLSAPIVEPSSSTSAGGRADD